MKNLINLELISFSLRFVFNSMDFLHPALQYFNNLFKTIIIDIFEKKALIPTVLHAYSVVVHKPILDCLIHISGLLPSRLHNKYLVMKKRQDIIYNTVNQTIKDSIILKQ